MQKKLVPFTKKLCFDERVDQATVYKTMGCFIYISQIKRKFL